ncbi:MAG: phage terminase small subunit P27 family [Phycisphaeraceae bacterium]|nr:phage terminase small subunit P27 family [Phycisphaeraceae bacterium]
MPPPGGPVCPDWIDDDAKKVWTELVTILEAMGVLTSADTYSLTRYCQLLARWKRVEMFIQKYGETYTLTSAAGKVKCVLPFPQVGMAMKLSMALTKLEQEFGLTPSARSRIQVDMRFLPPEELTEFEREFLVGD